MKQLVLLLFLFNSAASAVCAQIIRENFETHNLKDAIFLFSEARFGNFIYEFGCDGAPVDSSSLATYFDNDGSIFVGQQKRVTDFSIKSYNGHVFALNSLQLSSNHSFSNPDEKVVVRGFCAGKLVTTPVTLEIRKFEPPGRDYDMAAYKGFEKVDEVKITGNDLQFTLESFAYTPVGPPVVKRKPPKKDGNKKR